MPGLSIEIEKPHQPTDPSSAWGGRGFASPGWEAGGHEAVRLGLSSGPCGAFKNGSSALALRPRKANSVLVYLSEAPGWLGRREPLTAEVLPACPSTRPATAPIRQGPEGWSLAGGGPVPPGLGPCMRYMCLPTMLPSRWLYSRGHLEIPGEILSCHHIGAGTGFSAAGSCSWAWWRLGCGRTPSAAQACPQPRGPLWCPRCPV